MSFLRKGIVVSGGQTLGLFLNVLANVIYARVLDPEGMGQFELFRQVRSIGTTTLTLGLGNAAIYFINSRHLPVVEVASSIIKTSLVLWAVAIAALSAIFLGFAHYFGYVSAPVAIIFAAGVGANMSMWTLRPILMAEMKTYRFVAVDLIAKIVLLAGGGAAALLGVLTTEVALVLLAASCVSSFLLAAWFLRRQIRWRVPLDFSLIRRLAGYGVRLASADVLLVVIGSVTILLLRWRVPDSFDDIGLYGRAVGLAGMVAFIPHAMLGLLYSKWSGAEHDVRARQAERASRLGFAFGVVMGGAAIIVGKYVIWFLYGWDYVGATTSLQILAVGLMFNSLSSVYTSMLYSAGRAGLSVLTLLGTLAVVATAAYFLAPAWGIEGAATAAAAGQAFTCLVTMTLCTRLLGYRPLHGLIPGLSDVRYIVASLRARKSGQ